MRKIKNEPLRVGAELGTIAVIILFMWFVVPAVASNFVTLMIAKMLVYVLFGISLYVLMGLGGMFSLCQVSLGGISGYILALGIKKWGWGFWQCVIVGIISVILFAFFFSLMSSRSSNMSFMMMTMCIANLVTTCTLTWTNITKGHNGINGITGPSINGVNYSGTRKTYYLLIIVVPICYYLVKRLSKSPFGLSCIGMRDNVIKMNSIGFNTRLIRIVEFVVSGFFAAIAGILFALFFAQMSPDNIKGTVSLLTVLMMFIGGIVHLEGAFAGALVYVILDNVVSRYTSLSQACMGLIFLICVFVIPNGILGIPIFSKDFWIEKVFKKKTAEDK